MQWSTELFQDPQQRASFRKSRSSRDDLSPASSDVGSARGLAASLSPKSASLSDSSRPEDDKGSLLAGTGSATKHKPRESTMGGGSAHHSPRHSGDEGDGGDDRAHRIESVELKLGGDKGGRGAVADAGDDVHIELRPRSPTSAVKGTGLQPSKSHLSDDADIGGDDVGDDVEFYDTELAAYKQMAATAHPLDAVHDTMHELKNGVVLFWDALKVHHDILNVMYDNGKQYKWSMKFSFMITIKVLVVLFVGCLVAPREYLCATGDGNIMPLPLLDDKDTVVSIARTIMEYTRGQFVELVIQALV